MRWRDHAGMLATWLATALLVGCTPAPKAATRPSPAAVTATATTVPSAPTSQPAYDNIPALIAAIHENCGATVVREHGTISVPGVRNAPADRLVVTSADGNNKLTLWILSPASSAAVAAWRDAHHRRPGRDQWNGLTYVLSDHSLFGSWLRDSVEECLDDTNAPLTVAIVAGPRGPELELTNRSPTRARVPEPMPDAPRNEAGYAVWVDSFGTAAFYGDSAPEPPRPNLTDLAPGARISWPMSITVAPGTDAKIDAGYHLTERDAENFHLPRMGLIAPTVRVHCDAAGNYTVTPWKPNPLSAEESATSSHLAEFAPAWIDDVTHRLDAAVDVPPRHTITRDAAGQIDQVHFTLVYFSEVGMSHLRLDATREGDRHGLAIAAVADQIHWDGQQTDRAYRVPGSDWILHAQTDAGVSPQVQAAIDECLNAFQHQARSK